MELAPAAQHRTSDKRRIIAITFMTLFVVFASSTVYLLIRKSDTSSVGDSAEEETTDEKHGTSNQDTDINENGEPLIPDDEYAC